MAFSAADSRGVQFAVGDPARGEVVAQLGGDAVPVCVGNADAVVHHSPSVSWVNTTCTVRLAGAAHDAELEAAALRPLDCVEQVVDAADRVPLGRHDQVARGKTGPGQRDCSRSPAG